MANPKKQAEVVPLSRVVFRAKDGRCSVVRQHFEAVLVGEEPIVSNTTRDDASILMEQALEDETAARREAEGW